MNNGKQIIPFIIVALIFAFIWDYTTYRQPSPIFEEPDETIAEEYPPSRGFDYQTDAYILQAEEIITYFITTIEEAMVEVEGNCLILKAMFAIDNNVNDLLKDSEVEYLMVKAMQGSYAKTCMVELIDRISAEKENERGRLVHINTIDSYYLSVYPDLLVQASLESYENLSQRLHLTISTPKENIEGYQFELKVNLP